jgi:hypothetical protein
VSKVLTSAKLATIAGFEAIEANVLGFTSNIANQIIASPAYLYASYPFSAEHSVALCIALPDLDTRSYLGTLFYYSGIIVLRRRSAE